MADNKVKREKNGYWQKGCSGNSAGRPKSEMTLKELKASKAKFVEIAARNVEKWAPDVIMKAIDLAKRGDAKMITLLFDKFFEIKEAQFTEILLSATAAEIAESQDIVIARATRGEVSSSYALDIMKALTIKRDSIIVKDLEAYVNEQKAKENARL